MKNASTITCGKSEWRSPTKQASLFGNLLTLIRGRFIFFCQFDLEFYRWYWYSLDQCTCFFVTVVWCSNCTSFDIAYNNDVEYIAISSASIRYKNKCFVESMVMKISMNRSLRSRLDLYPISPSDLETYGRSRWYNRSINLP